jgi:hypothetical protein
MRKFGLVLAAALWACSGLQTARAAISYQYVVLDPTTFNPVTSFTAAAPGASVTANLYLQETVTGTDTSLLPSELGIFGAGVFVTKSGTAGDTTVASVAPNNQTEPNGFQGPTSTGNTSTTGRILESLSTSATSGPTGSTTGGHISTVNGTTTTDVFLGTITLTAGSVGSLTTYTVESYKNFSNSDGNTITFNRGLDLDVTNNGTAGGATYTGADNATFTFTVTATPEPGGLLLGGLAASGIGLGAWRRWRTLAAA